MTPTQYVGHRLIGSELIPIFACKAPGTRREEAHCPVASSLSAAQQYIAKRVRIEDRGHSTPCWIWQGCVNHHGYGVARLPERGWARVHRAAYEEYVGPIPEGLQTDHLCMVKACCNPEHLEPVPPRENLKRFWSSKGVELGQPRPRTISRGPKTHCKRGHEFTPENTRIRGDDGARRCLACRRDDQVAYRLRYPEKVREFAKRYRAQLVTGHLSEQAT